MNCVACGVRKSTRSDLLCDECRALKTSSHSGRAVPSGSVGRGHGCEPRDITNPDDDPGLRDFLEHARTDMFPKMKASAFTIIIAPGEDPDPKICLELGAALLYDKPILLAVPKGRKIPLNLKSIAVEIVEFDNDNLAESKERMNAAIERVRKMADFRGIVEP